MYFNAKEESLYTSDGRLVKKFECPIRLVPEDLTEIRKSSDRTCEVCRSRILSLDGLSDDDALSLVQSSPESCHFLSRVDLVGADRAKANLQPKEYPMQRGQHYNPEILGTETNRDIDEETAADGYDCRFPRIRTVREMSRIEELSMAGARLLIKPIVLSSQIRQKAEVWRDTRTGSLFLNNDYRRDMRHEGSDWELVIPWFFYRPNPPQGAIAAYIIPLGLQPNDRVYIEDLIEDIPTNINEAQGDADRLKSAYATWSGTDFVVEIPMSIGVVG